MRMAAAERLALAVVVSAGAHFAVLAHVPLTPGRGEVSLLAGQPLTARIAASTPQDSPQVGELPLPRVPEPAVVPAVAQAQAQATGLPSVEFYFRASDLDERAVPLNEVNLVYPERAFASNQSGIVTLRLKIDHKGMLRDASVVDAQPPGIFEDAALEAVQELRFRPAVRNGVPVGSVKTIEVPFYPDCARTGSCIARTPEGTAQR